MSSYIPNSKLMKNERVLEKKEKRKKKKWNRVCFWKKKRNFYKGDLELVW